MNTAFDRAHQALRDRSRRVIFNNDGCDVFTVPPDQEPTAESLLAQRTRNLAGTQVDVLSYTTISSGFSLFTHATRVGEVLARPHPVLANNIAPALIEQGRDCLQIMTDFGHAHAMEVFWSMRMNDTHDGAHRPEKPYFLFPRLKREHPEFLVGTPENPPRHGAWSAVNYGRPEIRELAFRFVEEVCQRYDIDGIDLDFFRHPVFFKSVAGGSPATPDECAAMTDLLQRICGMCRREGQRRCRPILLAARTPDSFGYSRAIGLDIERWMAEGLLDFWIPGGYFRLNPWPYSVERVRKYGVKLWAGLSESRVGGGHHRHAGRASDEGYRGRALNALATGADSVYLFNLFDPARRLWNELGDPAQLRTRDRRYFVSVLGHRNAAGGNLPYDPFRTLPDLNPDNPVEVSETEPFSTWISLRGIPEKESSAETEPDIRLVLLFAPQTPVPPPDDLLVSLNEQRLPPGEATEEGLAWKLEAPMLRNGKNDIDVQRRTGGAPATLHDIRVDIRMPPPVRP